ncbi:FxsC protein [Embleya scabrispora]|uniref:FxsC protein n=1 Tax=Embleya scabrispora TaxID=159449 RepID=UPI00036A8F98|nr:FxsC protein [Embleya scabrispora]MYS86050.1 hypothetical protein [Streptomyces sp. SID5474]
MGDTTSHYFYLSHVRRTDDLWVREFFGDLSLVVAERTERPTGQVGVLPDRRPGPPSADLMDRCLKLVVLHSSRYFTREDCTREWAFFQQRTEVHWSRTKRSMDVIVPIIWTPMPPGMERIAPSGDWPAEIRVSSPIYEQEGLLHLLRFKPRYHREYEEVLHAVADRLLSPSTSARARVAPLGHGLNGRARPAPVAAPRHTVDFVLSVLGADELPPERTSRRFYGADPLDWAPYDPTETRSLVALARETAGELEFTSTVQLLDETLPALTDRRPHPRQLTVLLLDAWITRTAALRSLLTSVDDVVVSAAVLEPRPHDDTESAAHADVLDAALDRCLPRLRGKYPVQSGCWAVPDRDRFTRALRETLARAQNDAMKADTHRRSPVMPTGSFDRLPLLGGSSS